VVLIDVSLGVAVEEVEEGEPPALVVSRSHNAAVITIGALRYRFMKTSECVKRYQIATRS